MRTMSDTESVKDVSLACWSWRSECGGANFRLGVRLQTSPQKAGCTPANSMGVFALAHPIATNLARVLSRSNRTPSGPVAGLNALFKRIRQRLYPESVPVLAS